MGIENLGRILVIHKGEYNPATAYVPMDEVSYNGSTYRCYIACTNILPSDTSKWRLVASGNIGGGSSFTIADSVRTTTVISASASILDSGHALSASTGWASKQYVSIITLNVTVDWSKTSIDQSNMVHGTLFPAPNDPVSGRSQVYLWWWVHSVPNIISFDIIEHDTATVIHQLEELNKTTAEQIVSVPGVRLGKSRVDVMHGGRYSYISGQGQNSTTTVQSKHIWISADNEIHIKNSPAGLTGASKTLTPIQAITSV